MSTKFKMVLQMRPKLLNLARIVNSLHVHEEYFILKLSEHARREFKKNL